VAKIHHGPIAHLAKKRPFRIYFARNGDRDCLDCAALALPVTSGLLAQQELRAPARQLQLFAKTARRLAVEENQPYIMTLTPQGFQLQIYKKTVETKSTFEKEETKDLEPILTYKMPAAVNISIRRWGGKEWRKLKEDSWIFQPTGLCEPLAIRLDRGPGWMEIEFNPLTASVANETYFFP
jgi:hypothetical protein